MHTVLLVFAFVLLVLAGFNVSHPRLNLTALGLALWLASMLLPLR